MQPNKITYKVVYRRIKYPRIELKTGKIVIILPKGHEPEQILRKHEKWIQDKLNIISKALTETEEKSLVNRGRDDLKRIVERFAGNYERELGVNINKIFIRRMKTKWASCSSRHNLTINELMKHLPEQLIGYIIYHELAHLIEKRHNEKFWRIISRKYPDYQKLENQLLAYWFLIMRTANPIKKRLKNKTSRLS